EKASVASRTEARESTVVGGRHLIPFIVLDLLFFPALALPRPSFPPSAPPDALARTASVPPSFPSAVRNCASAAPLPAPMDTPLIAPIPAPPSPLRAEASSCLSLPPIPASALGAHSDARKLRAELGRSRCRAEAAEGLHSRAARDVCAGNRRTAPWNRTPSLPSFLHTPAPLTVVSALSFIRQPALPPPRPCYQPPTLAAAGGERQGRGWFSAGGVLCWRGSLLAGFAAGGVLCWRGSLLAGFSAGGVLCWRGSLLAGFSAGGVLCWRGSLLAEFSAGGVLFWQGAGAGGWRWCWFLVLAAGGGAGSWCWRLALLVLAAGAGAGSWCWRLALVLVPGAGGWRWCWFLVLAAGAGAGSWCWRLGLVLVPGAWCWCLVLTAGAGAGAWCLVLVPAFRRHSLPPFALPPQRSAANPFPSSLFHPQRSAANPFPSSLSPPQRPPLHTRTLATGGGGG
ncbi:unnamed protein product, partial [Closterium sp. Naga37s-1]